ncbi:unnamed protein product [Lymnaea stagnalis]|uniref:Apple domain-containing protein n=1 Tax=Lymnaea stagnalis TaxID=6523 RepID=A0AAV2IJ83_LYMST
MIVNCICMLLLLVVVKWVHASINLFQPNENNVVQGDSANGRIYYSNDTRFIPTCGWRLILSSADILFSVEMHDASPEKVDDYTFILTSIPDKGRTFGLVSDIIVSGNFRNQFPSLFITWFCVCNDSTASPTSPASTCQPVGCETIAPTRADSVSRCTQVPGPGTTTAGTTPHPTVDLQDFQLSSSSSPCNKILDRKGDYCYSGDGYMALTSIHHFVDCCAICCASPACEGVNFHQGAHECDIVVVKIESNSTFLTRVQDCMFWKVGYQS